MIFSLFGSASSGSPAAGVLGDHGVAARLLGVVHEEAPVLRVVGVEGDAEQALLVAAALDLGVDVQERGRDLLSALDDRDDAVLLADEQPLGVARRAANEDGAVVAGRDLGQLQVQAAARGRAVEGRGRAAGAAAAAAAAAGDVAGAAATAAAGDVAGAAAAARATGAAAASPALVVAAARARDQDQRASRGQKPQRKSISHGRSLRRERPRRKLKAGSRR